MNRERRSFRQNPPHPPHPQPPREKIPMCIWNPNFRLHQDETITTTTTANDRLPPPTSFYTDTTTDGTTSLKSLPPDLPTEPRAWTPPPRLGSFSGSFSDEEDGGTVMVVAAQIEPTPDSPEPRLISFLLFMPN